MLGIACPDGLKRCSLSVRTRLELFVEHLSPEGKRLFVMLTLLHEGDIAGVLRAVPATCEAELVELSSDLPLVHLSPSEGRTCFEVRQPCAEYVLTSERLRPLVNELWLPSAQSLEEDGKLDRACDLYLRFASPREVAEFALRCAGALLRSGALGLVARIFERISPSVLLSSASLLLLEATLHVERGQFESAIGRATAARAIAEYEGNPALVREALQFEIFSSAELGDLARASEAAAELLMTGDPQDIGPTAIANARLHLGLAAVASGQVAEAIGHIQAASAIVPALSHPRLCTRVRANGAVAQGLLLGTFSDAARTLADITASDWALPSDEVRTWGNLGSCLMETGRLERAMACIANAADRAEDVGRASLAESYRAVAHTIAFTNGNGPAVCDLRDSIASAASAGDRVGAEHARIYLSVCLRAAGETHGALTEAEMAHEFFRAHPFALLADLATYELAAGFLDAGDCGAARRLLCRVNPDNLYHLLRADMVLAEIDRRQGRVDDAVERIAAHREYILTESSNWQIAMYARAFPGLLGVFARAVGVAELPSHLLRMIPAESAEQILVHSRDVLPESAWSELGRRFFGADEFGVWLERDGKPLCRVRLFGGLDVSVGGKRLADTEWRKRKARLLFAMLAVRRGQEVTRDQLQEYLWPDMDETRSRNNLYVTWNSMKSVLMEGVTRGECPYVSNAGGRCRIVPENVRTDVEEFESSLVAARVAEASRDRDQAIAAYARAADVYRGELLPGDVYDEWFAATRDHYRGEYCDAMRRLCEMLVQAGDPGAGAAFARRGLAADPFREDLYQSALKAQIADGQRSAAVDTYFQCRSRLADELGLDPSPETQALYEQVLGMEETRSGFSATEPGVA
jgi:DNA-binding SARP family transcriptional activator